MKHKLVRYRQPKNIKQKKTERAARTVFWKIFSMEGGLFLLASILSVISAFKLDKLAKIQEIYLPKTSWQEFLLFFLLATILILVFISYKKAGKFKELIYKGLFVSTVFWGGMTVLNLILPVFGTILVMGVLITLWLEFPTVWVHNILMVLGLAGATSFLGLSFVPSAVVALLLFFSVYDFIAVYKTKHMIVMAKEMIERKVILGFIIPKEIKLFTSKLKEFKLGKNFTIIGGGDVALPGLLAVSVVPSGLLRALVIVAFSLLGFLFSYWLFVSQKNSKDRHEPIPALPPIALISIIGYFITLFF